MTAAQDEAKVDTRDMLVVHSALRREFRLASGLIRQCPEGDLERTRLVTEHLRLILQFVDRHHTGEDQLLWPKLLERVPEDVARLVHLMEEQHAKVHDLTDQATERLTIWERTAAVPDRDGVAEVFDALYATLEQHLTAEEEHILPLVEIAITPAEYAQLGEEGMQGVAKKQLPLLLGAFMYEGDPVVIKHMLSKAPLLPRLLMPRIGPRAYARYAQRVYGTRTP